MAAFPPFAPPFPRLHPVATASSFRFLPRLSPFRVPVHFSPSSFSSFPQAASNSGCHCYDGSGFSGGHGDLGGGGGGNGGGDDHDDNHGNGSHDSFGKIGILSALVRGWKDRVGADPQFPFKVLMEEVVGVGACVVGDMASRPNFGLDELDFVFSTIIVASLLNFCLMYMLAPTSSMAASALPSIFATCPTGYMFQQGSYTFLERLGTFVYKGTIFASVGFLAGLLGTAISNLLIRLRTKMEPTFKSQNEAPPTMLNAATWALHMGGSSNLRYQAINGVEFAMANVLSPSAFKVSVFFTRALNNVLGGMSFVALARCTGSQKAKVESGDDKCSHSGTMTVDGGESTAASPPVSPHGDSANTTRDVDGGESSCQGKCCCKG